MEFGNVTADSIVVERECRADAKTIKALAIDIRDNGLQVPVLVGKTSRVLVDGLTRLKAYEKLGWSVVPAQFTVDPIVADDLMEKLRDGQIVVTHERTCEILVDFKILSRVRESNRRRKPRGAKAPPIGEGVRGCVSRATGYSENTLTRVNVIKRMADEGDPNAIEVLEGIFKEPPGGPVIGFGRILQIRHRKGLSMSVEERTETIKSVLRSVDLNLAQINRIGGFDELDEKDSRSFIQQLSEIASVARTTRTALRKGLS